MSAPDELHAEIERDIAEGTDPHHPVRRWLRERRAAVARRAPWVLVTYRVGVALLGLTIVVVGLILVPLPGPGWLIVFLGLAVLGTEFRSARRVSHWLRRQLARFWAWWKARRARR